jgi:hypothetical protein
MFASPFSVSSNVNRLELRITRWFNVATLQTLVAITTNVDVSGTHVPDFLAANEKQGTSRLRDTAQHARFGVGSTEQLAIDDFVFFTHLEPPKSSQ